MKTCGFMLFAITIAIIPDVSVAYKVETHKQINEFVLERDRSFVYIDDIIKSKLGYDDGIKAHVDGDSIIDWLKFGGEAEDNGFRAFNHFLDPLGTDFDSRRFHAIFFYTYPADQWAMDYNDAQGDVGDKSWPRALTFYDLAITSSTKGERDTNLALTFRSIGQVMHLVEDMSVPSHTRNDLAWDHLFNPLERWCNRNQHKVRKILENDNIFLPNTIPVSPSYAPIVRIPGDGASRYWKLFSLFDNNDGTGLAEYSNANFASPNTISNSRFDYYNNNYYIYQYPKFDQLLFETVNGSNENVYSYHTLLDEFSIRINPYIVEVIPDPGSGLPSYFTVSEDCVNEHAKVLIPKAASYAARVLELFFDKEIVPYIYSSGNEWRIENVDIFGRRYPATKAEMDSLGDSKVIKTLEGSCCEPPLTPLNYGRLFVFAEDGSEDLTPYSYYPVEGCPSRFLYVADYMGDPGDPGPVMPAIIWANLSVEPQAGYSLKDGFSTRLVEPKMPDCEVVPLYADGQPLVPDSVEAFKIWGVNPDETEDLLLDSPGAWPSFGGGAAKYYKKYRMEFKGVVKGDSIHLGTNTSEATENFDYAILVDEYGYSKTYDMGNGTSMHNSQNGVSSYGITISNNGLSYDEPSPDDCSADSHVVSWVMPKESDQLTKITNNSRIRIDYNGSVLTFNQGIADHFTIGIGNPVTMPNGWFTIESRNPAELDNMTLGDLIPEAFQNGEEYNMSDPFTIQFEFPSCTGDGFYFTISSFSFLP